ncbi:hypothetical protein CVU83_00745 [Candidatus Falkowbacteria bacterium HGW-Falkowbacteria-2]|uniref:Uncharacterized protein n=1 Tax=Candidatus Falkowbacteria bacterium HGW-Falkowbacteria-2 TaxID=2013769 RepID=A0A2N2E2V6_9BACT|nr:MAG: hypothetical protein CVU83_00745 [Candidatus Falkowbacteria bacterium HGW-Falkowbacteria-2]
MSIDEQLMRAPAITTEKEQPDSQADESAERSGSLREQRRGGASDEYPPDNYFAAMYGARLKNRKEQAEKAKKGASWQSFKKSVSSGTSKLLVSAWRNILYTFGLSFFYVYGHLVLKNIFGDDLFAPLGSEWADKPGITKEQRDRRGAKIKTYEVMGVLIVSLVLLVAILSAFIIPALIIEVIKNPLRSGVMLLELFWSWITGE